MIYCSDQEAREAIIETGHQLYDQGLTVGTDGNISCRVSDLGHVQVAPYATPGTAALAESIIPFCRENNAVLLANHGAVTWGKDLSEACARMETLERSARIRYYCLTMGKASYLSPEEATILHQKGVALGNFEA